MIQLWNSSLWMIIAGFWIVSSMVALIGLPSLGDIGHGKIICVYPISGQYGLIPRMVFDLTLAFGTLFGKHEWLVFGAIGSALTFAGSTAVHAIILFFFTEWTSDQGGPALDLDIIACAMILLPCTTMGSILGTNTAKLKKDKAKSIVITSTALTAAGSMFSILLVGISNFKSQYPCQSSNGTTLLRPADHQLENYNCTYACFTSANPMRELNDAQIIDNSYLHNLLVLLPISMLLSIAIMGIAIMLRALDKAPARLWPFAPCTQSLIFVVAMELAVVGQVGPLSVGPPLPTGEQDSAVGQWSPGVVVVLVLVAALIEYTVRRETASAVDDGDKFTDDAAERIMDLEQQLVDLRSASIRQAGIS